MSGYFFLANSKTNKSRLSKRKGLTIHTHLPVYSYLLLPGRSQ
ncbi:hypothetical protein HMPREF2534_03147 [Bacteroides thetaiotaomicron]|nr:hypothetical protein HMPREF2534_03147 [Bacteroides thetaiotaomicron]